MIPNMNLSEARSEGIDAGGYVMRIREAKIDLKYNRLQLFMDIAEGEKAGYFERLNAKAGFWAMVLNLYLDHDSAWKFARAIDAIKASNEGFTWNDDGVNDEQTLVGKYIGVVTRKVEYMGNDGVVKKKLRAYSTLPVNDIREGNFKVPDLLPLQSASNQTPVSGVVDTTASSFEPMDDEELPF